MVNTAFVFGMVIAIIYNHTLHYLLCEWRVIVDQVETNSHGRPVYFNLSGVTELLIMRSLIIVGCVLVS